MQSPFDTKNKAASMLDGLALRLLAYVLCVGYFLLLWRRLPESLIAGTALFLLAMLTLALFERSTLARRDRALRERIGGAIALEELLLLPNAQACDRICALLARTLGAQADGDAMDYEGQRWLVRCTQCLRGANASEGDVLGAHRARAQAGASQCLLACTGGFSPGAIRAAEWVDPPIRLISGNQLAALFGRCHPATDEEIARHAKRRRVPFSFARMRTLALAHGKLRRYLLCAFLLLVFYLTSGSLLCLVSCLMAFLLALLCHKENSRVFRL